MSAHNVHYATNEYPVGCLHSSLPTWPTAVGWGRIALCVMLNSIVEACIVGVSVLEAVHATVLVAGEAAYARVRHLRDKECACVRVYACVRDPRHHVLIPKASRTITKKTPIEVPTTVIRAMVAHWETSSRAIR